MLIGAVVVLALNSLIFSPPRKCRIADHAASLSHALPIADLFTIERGENSRRLDVEPIRGEALQMAAKPQESDPKSEELKTPVPGPVGDGFPREKDVSTPPPGSDQADAEKKKK